MYENKELDVVDFVREMAIKGGACEVHGLQELVGVLISPAFKPG
jgi:hypothetical protein